MSFYRERFGHREGEFPVCEQVARRSLALPFFPQITEAQIERVCERLQSDRRRVAAVGRHTLRACRACPSPRTPTSRG